MDFAQLKTKLVQVKENKTSTLVPKRKKLSRSRPFTGNETLENERFSRRILKLSFFQIKLTKAQKWSNNLRVKPDDKNRVYNVFILKRQDSGDRVKKCTQRQGNIRDNSV